MTLSRRVLVEFRATRLRPSRNLEGRRQRRSRSRSEARLPPDRDQVGGQSLLVRRAERRKHGIRKHSRAPEAWYSRARRLSRSVLIADCRQVSLTSTRTFSSARLWWSREVQDSWRNCTRQSSASRPQTDQAWPEAAPGSERVDSHVAVLRELLVLLSPRPLNQQLRPVTLHVEDNDMLHRRQHREPSTTFFIQKVFTARHSDDEHSEQRCSVYTFAVFLFPCMPLDVRLRRVIEFEPVFQPRAAPAFSRPA